MTDIKEYLNHFLILEKNKTKEYQFLIKLI